MSPDRGIEVWDVALRVPVAGEGAARRPVVRSGRARIGGATLFRLLARAEAPKIEGRLVEGGAEVTVKLPLVTLTAVLAAAAPGNGRLRLEATSLRLGGLLPVPGPLIDLAVGQFAEIPGIYRAGRRAVDLDLGELLAPLPLRWETGIRGARVTREYLEIECGEP